MEMVDVMEGVGLSIEGENIDSDDAEDAIDDVNKTHDVEEAMEDIIESGNSDFEDEALVGCDATPRMKRIA